MANRQWNWLQNDNRQERSGGLPTVRPSGSISYFGPISHFFDEVDHMFDNALQALGVPAFTRNMVEMNTLAFYPHLDISSTDNEYIIQAEVPGTDERDMKVEVNEDGLLTIQGEKRVEQQGDNRNFHRSERAYGFFQRTLFMPEDLDRSSIEAHFRNGVLTITAEKRQSSSESRARRIEVSGGGESVRHSPRVGRPEGARPEGREPKPEAANANPRRAA